MKYIIIFSLVVVTIHADVSHQKTQSERQYLPPELPRSKDTHTHGRHYEEGIEPPLSQRRHDSYVISKPKALPDPPTVAVPRSNLHTFVGDLPLRERLFNPAANGGVPQAQGSDHVVYATAPNSVFHTQINVQSQGSEFNVPNAEADQESRSARIGNFASSSSESDYHNKNRHYDQIDHPRTQTHHNHDTEKSYERSYHTTKAPWTHSRSHDSHRHEDSYRRADEHVKSPNFQGLNLINGNVAADQASRVPKPPENFNGNAQGINVINGNILGSGGQSRQYSHERTYDHHNEQPKSYERKTQDVHHHEHKNQRQYSHYDHHDNRNHYYHDNNNSKQDHHEDHDNRSYKGDQHDHHDNRSYKEDKHDQHENRSPKENKHDHHDNRNYKDNQHDHHDSRSYKDNQHDHHDNRSHKEAQHDHHDSRNFKGDQRYHPDNRNHYYDKGFDQHHDNNNSKQDHREHHDNRNYKDNQHDHHDSRSYKEDKHDQHDNRNYKENSHDHHDHREYKQDRYDHNDHKNEQHNKHEQDYKKTFDSHDNHEYRKFEQNDEHKNQYDHHDQHDQRVQHKHNEERHSQEDGVTAYTSPDRSIASSPAIKIIAFNNNNLPIRTEALAPDFENDASASASELIYKPGDEIDFAETKLIDYADNKRPLDSYSYTPRKVFRKHPNRKHSETDLRADGYHYTKPSVSFNS